MIINYQSARAERRTEPPCRYDEEILSVNWNPAIGLIASSCEQSEREDLSPNLPEDSSSFDVDSFLDHVYALATRV